MFNTTPATHILNVSLQHLNRLADQLTLLIICQLPKSVVSLPPT